MEVGSRVICIHIYNVCPIAYGGLSIYAEAFVKLVAEPTRDLQDITFWMMGGLWNASFPALASVVPAALGSLAVLWAMRWRLNVLSLNDRTAHSVGLSPRRDKTVLLVAAAVGTASVVSVCGLVGWVGLLVPHLDRKSVV